MLIGEVSKKCNIGVETLRYYDKIGLLTVERKNNNRYYLTPTQVAILWTIQNKGVVTGLTGPTKIEHLKENSQVLNLSLNTASIEEINQLIEKEEDKLRKTMYEEVYSILTSSFSSDYEKTYKDLIYVIEYCMENQLISYNDGIDAYMEIEKDKSLGNKSMDRLNEIRNEIKSILY
ncbi:MAG: MerR family DNA-binding transcriptional regulator [Tissierellia bacterium]|nr:MerR family DNA-binding transcriptional regulator [Tissierellia bacterium]